MRLFISSFLLLFMACGSSRKSEVTEAVPAGYTDALVKDFKGLDGCGYLLIGTDSTRYEPVNLEPAFQKDGLRVFFKFKRFDGMSICMAGKMITITEIRPAKP